MTMSDEQLRRLLQSALPPPPPAAHPRNAWPMIAARLDSGPAWTMFDLTLAGASASRCCWWRKRCSCSRGICDGDVLMRPHPYLRAYMAGIVVPTIFLLCAMTVYAVFRFYLEVPSQFVFGIPAAPLEG